MAPKDRTQLLAIARRCPVRLRLQRPHVDDSAGSSAVRVSKMPVAAQQSATLITRKRPHARLALLCLLTLMLSFIDGLGALTGLARASAQAKPTASAAVGATEELPAGYVTQRDNAVRWTYPSAAEDEVRSLRAIQAQTWRRIAAELGAAVSPELDIRVARNPEQMRALVLPNTPLPGYADGIAFPESGLVLLTLTDPDTLLRPDLQTVLTHELSHVALYRAARGTAVPRWFSEGLAMQQSQESSLSRVRTLWEGTLRGDLMPFDALTKGFPAQRSAVDLAYAQSSDFVGFMLSGGDERARFRVLMRELSSGRPFPQAVEAAYQVQLGYMEREWRATLTQRFGRWPMLFMGLTSLWVLGAVLLVLGYLRARARSRATLQRWALEEQPVLSAALITAPTPPAAPPAGAVQSSLDDFFDNRHAGKAEPGIPTVVHDGQSHTLH
jgi:hypothetical protein